MVEWHKEDDRGLEPDCAKYMTTVYAIDTASASASNYTRYVLTRFSQLRIDGQAIKNHARRPSELRFLTWS